MSTTFDAVLATALVVLGIGLLIWIVYSRRPGDGRHASRPTRHGVQTPDVGGVEHGPATRPSCFDYRGRSLRHNQRSASNNELPPAANDPPRAAVGARTSQTPSNTEPRPTTPKLPKSPEAPVPGNTGKATGYGEGSDLRPQLPKPPVGQQPGLNQAFSPRVRFKGIFPSGHGVIDVRNC